MNQIKIILNEDFDKIIDKKIIEKSDSKNYILTLSKQSEDLLSFEILLKIPNECKKCKNYKECKIKEKMIHMKNEDLISIKELSLEEEDNQEFLKVMNIINCLVIKKCNLN